MLEFKGVLDTAVTTMQAQPAASTMCSLEDLMEMDEGPPQGQGEDAQPLSEKARYAELKQDQDKVHNTHATSH